MNKPWKVMLAFLGIFVAGAVFGGFLSLRIVKAKAQKATSMDRFTARILHRYADRLELTLDQLDQIRPIVISTETELRRVRSAGMTETIAIAEKMNEQVAKVLTSEQMDKLEALKREMKSRWQRDRPRRNGGREPHDRPPPPEDPAPRDH